jgi:2-aminoethylphosphonate-pyruvate transaminase
MASKTPTIFVAGPSLMHERTKAAMNVDYSPREERFRRLIAAVRENFLSLVEAGDEYVTIPLQGGGTYAIEATIGSMIPATATVGILANGAYASRAIDICKRIQRKHVVIAIDEKLPISGEHVESLLRTDRGISHIYIVHCETQSGILNKLHEVSLAVVARGISLLVDAMSTVGCTELVTNQIRYDALIATANKCIEGPPGLSFVVARKEYLSECQNQSPSLALDLFSQWQSFENTGEFRFTPPTHVLAGIREALVILAEEGGPSARSKRYQKISTIVHEGFTALGVQPLLARELSSPAVVTFVAPQGLQEQREHLLEYLYKRGHVIYRSRISGVPTFQVGCMGQLQSDDAYALVRAAESFFFEGSN